MSMALTYDVEGELRARIREGSVSWKNRVMVNLISDNCRDLPFLTKPYEPPTSMGPPLLQSSPRISIATERHDQLEENLKHQKIE